jgi:hypothetical protein
MVKRQPLATCNFANALKAGLSGAKHGICEMACKSGPVDIWFDAAEFTDQAHA